MSHDAEMQALLAFITPGYFVKRPHTQRLHYSEAMNPAYVQLQMINEKEKMYVSFSYRVNKTASGYNIIKLDQ